ncbi:MAG: tRNA (adenosine(37)-N6)-threonylcarbamoyltransferase complex ATPase subunit type 1 TsaE [Planctomycetota bacterium]
MNTSAERDFVVETTGDEGTRRLAARLGAALAGGEVLGLDGPLGAGKTTFTKGLAEGLGIDPREVTSPTFLLLHELTGRVTLYHLDAYRVGDAEELHEIGGRDLFRGDAVVVVEWAERVDGFLPADRLAVDLDHVDEDSRRIRFRATGPEHARLIAVVKPEEAP